MYRRMKSFVLIAILCTSLLGSTASAAMTNCTESTATEKVENTDLKSIEEMSASQLSAIHMLNYITVLSQEINASANSRLYLDNVYSDIVNNINPNALDKDSLTEVGRLLDTIQAYQSIDMKRERLQYIYEQNQAIALQQAIPNPVSILNPVQLKSITKALVSVVFMAVDAKTSYDKYLPGIESKYFEEGWKLDAEASNNLHESRKNAFSYMVEMCRKNQLDSKFTLNEDSAEKFVEWENNDNLSRRVEFLEKNELTYQAYGKYWLVLAESYYQKGAYDKCLLAINRYESMHIDTFRKDRDYAKVLTLGVSSAQELYTGSKLLEIMSEYAGNIVKNIGMDDWSLRYFVAQVYLDMYALSGKEVYLKEVYKLTKENVNYLVNEQSAKNETYLTDIDEIKVKKSDPQKKEIEQYIEWQKEERTKLYPGKWTARV